MNKELASFRDPASILFFDNFHYYRGIGNDYLKHFEHFKTSGLKERLTSENLIINFDEINDEEGQLGQGYSNFFLRTKRLPFISYPSEWSFSQYKEAALLTLKICQIALKYGMILKDASAYNIQFYGIKPILIDLTSFEIYESGSPWKAYYQFCKHFLAPLFLSSKKNFHLQKLMGYFIDGIPLRITVSLCSFTDFFNWGFLIHLYLHSKVENIEVRGREIHNLKPKKLENIFIHLNNVIENLNWNQPITTWGKYNEFNTYNLIDKEAKVKIINKYINVLSNVKVAVDIGANNGTFSELLTSNGIYTIAIDMDEVAVERSFLKSKEGLNTQILPLHINFSNPTPSIGWKNEERNSFLARLKYIDLIQALAIIHHLVISDDITFEKIVALFADSCRYLIIEFIHVEDIQVQRMLITKPHHRKYYNQNNFETAFKDRFKLIEKTAIAEMSRDLYLYEKKD